MSQFYCREDELRKLNKRYAGDKFECIVIYGRRRVGKTALINEFCKDKPTIFFSALNTTGKENLEALSKSIMSFERPDMESAPEFRSYDAALDELTALSKEKRIVFVIDEYPYLAKAKPAISAMLQHIIDHKWTESKMYLILCGSSMSFMESQVLGKESPLYGRRTGQFKIEPLDYKETAVFHPNLSAEDNSLIYGITGGVPHYINKLDVRDSVDEALLDNFFDRSSYLYEEPGNLLKQELREPAIYNAIIKAIAEGASRMNDIKMKVGEENSVVSKYLKTLIDLGFVIKNVPITEKNPERSRKSLYYVSDNFIRFWFRYVYPYKGELELDNQQIVLDEMEKDFIQKFVAFSYELSLIHIFAELCRKGQIDFAPSRIGSYWRNDNEGDTEIDVAAVDNQHKRLFLGECKYHAKPVDVAVYSALQEKGQSKELTAAFKGYEIVYGLFSKSGFTDRLVKMAAENSNLILIHEDAVHKK